MPCVEETPKDIDVALQILDAATHRINANNEPDSAVIREVTQTDHLNKHLLKSFLKRLNVMAEVPTNSCEEDGSFQDFDD